MLIFWSIELTQVNRIRMSRPKELRKQLKDQVREELSQEEEDHERLCDAISNMVTDRKDNGLLSELDRNLIGKAMIIIIIIYYGFTI